MISKNIINYDGSSAPAEEITNNTPPEWLTKPSVAMFQSIHTKPGKNCKIYLILCGIRDGRWKDRIENLRSIPASQTDRKTKEKEKLPVFMASMSTHGGSKGTDLMNHSGLLQIDIDKIGSERARSLRDQMSNDCYVAAAWISPSGDGLKALVRIPTEQRLHLASFALARQHFKTRYEVQIDESCKNVNRNCFVGYDPDLFINFKALILPVTESETVDEKKMSVERRAARRLPHLSRGGPLRPAEDPFLKGDPDMLKLYRTLVSDRFGPPIRGHRNDTIVDIAAWLNYAVLPELGMELMKVYYRTHSDAFVDYPLEKVEQEYWNVINNGSQRFSDSLPPDIRTIYDSFSQSEQAAFRICDSLSRTEVESLRPPFFHLSCKHLGKRICCPGMTAMRMLRKFEGQNIVKLVSKGLRYSAGNPAKASIFEWLVVRSIQVD